MNTTTTRGEEIYAAVSALSNSIDEVTTLTSDIMGADTSSATAFAFDVGLRVSDLRQRLYVLETAKNNLIVILARYANEPTWAPELRGDEEAVGGDREGQEDS